MNPCGTPYLQLDLSGQPFCNINKFSVLRRINNNGRPRILLYFVSKTKINTTIIIFLARLLGPTPTTT